MNKSVVQYSNTLRCIACAVGICFSYSQITYCQEKYPEPAASSPGAYSQLQLMGVWSFVATTPGLASNEPQSHAQRGHWAIVHEGKPYLTVYAFEKTRLSGR